MKKLAIADIAQAEHLVAEHAEQIEQGLRVIDSRLLLGHTVVNLVALDTAGSLVLLLMDLTADDDTLLRAVDAYSWCLEYPETIQRLYPAAKFSLEQPPRILFAVERFPEAFLRKTKRLGFPAVDCVELRYLEANEQPLLLADLVSRVRAPSAFAYLPDVKASSRPAVRVAAPPPTSARAAAPPTIEPPKPRPQPVERIEPARPHPPEIEAAPVPDDTSARGGEWETFLGGLGLQAQPSPAQPTKAEARVDQPAMAWSPEPPEALPGEAEAPPLSIDELPAPSHEEDRSIRMVEGDEMAMPPASTNGVGHSAPEVLEPGRKVFQEMTLADLAQSDTAGPSLGEGSALGGPARDEWSSRSFHLGDIARRSEEERIDLALAPEPPLPAEEPQRLPDLAGEAPATDARLDFDESVAPETAAVPDALEATPEADHSYPAETPSAPAQPDGFTARPPQMGKASWAAAAKKIQPARIAGGLRDAESTKPNTQAPGPESDKRDQQRREWQELLKQLGGTIHIPEGAELSPRWQEVLSQLDLGQ